MEEKSLPDEDSRTSRRRFLRDSLRGTAPLLLGMAAAPGRPGSNDEQEVAAAPLTSSPPEAAEHAPEEAREDLDRKQEEFARNNPGMREYPSS